MKTYALLLVGCLLSAASVRAQKPTDDAPATLSAAPGEHPPVSPGQAVSSGDAPFLLVYLVKYNDNAAPRIALGLEKPVLRIAAVEKCVRLSHRNQNIPGVAAQLLPADAKTLVAAMKSLAAPDATTLPNLILWFATPDNQLLDHVSLGNSNREANIVQAGVLEFEPGEELTTINYLTEKLHLR